MKKEYYGKGYGEVANLPKEVSYERFPEEKLGLNVDLDDTARGIDANIEYNHDNLRRNLSREKY